MRRLAAAASALLLFVGLFTAASLAPITPAAPAAAANGADFNPGNIISDELFYNSTLMSEGGIQAFLEGRVPNCTAAAGAPACLKNYVASSSARGADQYCGAYAGGTNQRASTIIAQVAQACNINPQVLLVTLQKERGLVTKTAPNTGDYQISMGYACPDTAACDTRYYGFANQVFSAARQFNVYKKLPTSFNYRAGRTNTIQWHPNASCGSSQVYIENDATAALYNYTPYRPNQAALNNMNGTGDGCSSYGNRNFFAYFSDWFGSPTRGNLQSPSFEGGSVYGWGASNGPVNVMTARGTVGQVPNGEWFLATNTPAAGRAITQDVQRTTYAGQTITAKVWVRSESDKPFSGTAAVWGIGNSANEAASVPFTVTGTWTELTIKLPVQGSSHSLIRLDVYMNTTSGSMWMDNASISVGQTPPRENLLNNQSFEASFADWVPGNGFMNRAIYQDTRFVKHGSWFAASNTPVARRSFSQTVNVTGYVGDEYSFSIWLRSGDATVPFTGDVALWGLNSSQVANAVTSYSVVGDWTKVTATLKSPINFSQLKAEVYLANVNDTLFLDDASLSKNLLQTPSFEDGSAGGWSTGNGTITQTVSAGTPASPAADGTYYSTVVAQTASGSVAQNPARETTVGDTYTASVWVKAPSGTTAGTLALWGLGGTTELAQTGFTADGTWQLVTVALPITQQNHSALKFELYLARAGSSLLIDGASLK